MFRKILIAIGMLIGLMAVIVVAAGIAIMLIVDKSFIESRMSQALHRQVKIEKIDVSIFSLVSGIEIKKLTISNFKAPDQLVLLQDKPVSANDIFADTETLRFKIKFLPLFKKQFELSELVLYGPVINLAKNKQGVLNCADLIAAKKRPVEVPVESEKKQNETDKAKPRPMTADDIPLAVAVGAIGMKDGIINYYDEKFDQKFQLYNFTALAHDIRIDPRNLAGADEIKLKIALGLKTVGPLKTGSVQSFDIDIDATGRVIPFDPKTRQLEPEIILHAGFPSGQINGLQIFNSVAAIPLLGDYLGEHISFLKGKQEWKNSKTSFVDLRYKAGRVDISNGTLDLGQARMIFAGMVHTDSKALDLNLDMVMKKEINDSIKQTLAKKIDAGIRSPEIRKYIDSNKLAETALQPLFNKDGLIDLKFKAGGTTQKTDVKIVHPRLESVNGFIQKAAGSVLMEAGKEAGKGAAKKLIEEEKGKVLEGAFDLLKKK